MRKPVLSIFISSVCEKSNFSSKIRWNSWSSQQHAHVHLPLTLTHLHKRHCTLILAEKPSASFTLTNDVNATNFDSREIESLCCCSRKLHCWSTARRSSGRVCMSEPVSEHPALYYFHGEFRCRQFSCWSFRELYVRVKLTLKRVNTKNGQTTQNDGEQVKESSMERRRWKSSTFRAYSTGSMCLH